MFRFHWPVVSRYLPCRNNAKIPRRDDRTFSRVLKVIKEARAASNCHGWIPISAEEDGRESFVMTGASHDAGLKTRRMNNLLAGFTASRRVFSPARCASATRGRRRSELLHPMVRHDGLRAFSRLFAVTRIPARSL